MDNRDFRVRTFLYILNEGVTLGLYNHVLGVKDEAVDINLGSPNAEMRKVEFGDVYIVEYDLCFPPELQDTAEGLFNHTKNIPAVPLPNPDEFDETGFVSIERCGHRIGESCTVIDRYEVI